MWNTLITRPRVSALRALVLVLGACKGPESPAEHVAGTYSLVSVNSKPLPAPVGADQTDTVQAGTFSLRGDESFSSLTTFSDVNISAQGTFTINSGLLAFQESGAGRSYVGTIFGDELTVNIGTDAWVYHRAQ